MCIFILKVHWGFQEGVSGRKSFDFVNTSLKNTIFYTIFTQFNTIVLKKHKRENTIPLESDLLKLALLPL